MAEIIDNADPAELAKFGALAHRWWDPSGEFKPLHDINPLRLGHIEAQCGGLAGKAVLDVGCGGGILAEAMAEAGASVTGIDLSEPGRAGSVICGDTTAQSKPHPAPLLAAAAALSVLPEHCVYVGDAERDVIAGRAAGMHTLFAAYGYCGTDETPAAWNADGELDSLEALLAWLPLTADIALP